MSQARIEFVKKSRKAQGTCRVCGVELPVGSAYRYYYVGFRSSYKHVHCMDPKCSPTREQRESSNLAGLYGVIDSQLDSLDSVTDFESLQAIAEEVSSVAKELSSEYEEASTNDYGTVFNYEAEERAGQLLNYAENIQSFSPEDCPSHNDELHDGCDECDEALENSREALRDLISQEDF